MAKRTKHSSQDSSGEEHKEVSHQDDNQQTGQPDKATTSSSSSKGSSDEEPRWYHYVIVLAVLGGIIGLVYVGIYFYETGGEMPLENATKQYTYEHTVGNVTYNIQLNHRIDELERMDYPVEPGKLDLLNSRNFTFSYLTYNGTDNGKVVAASTKLKRYLDYVYHFSFNRSSFVEHNVTNCSDSTMRSKVVVYDPYAEENGVFFNQSNGCIEVSSTSIERLSQVNDLFIYSLTQQ